MQKKISIVIPCYNEEQALGIIYEKLVEIAAQMTCTKRCASIILFFFA